MGRLTGKDGQAVWPADVISQDEFTALVWDQGRGLYRDLPWRGIDDAYGVLVSEVMLQQTQVSRVLGRWERFMAKFPTVDALAAAATSDVLEEWQGMGYNRRALMLKRACEACASSNQGQLPRTYEGLLALPGVGPSSAAGVMAFAWNLPAVYVETNVRTVFIHHLFPCDQKVADSQLRPLVAASCPADNPREWYYALLDYGAHLKTLKGRGRDAARRSASYTRQSAFEGSHRQKRAEILRCVLEEPGVSLEAVEARLNAFERSRGRGEVEHALVEAIARDLVAEGFFHCEAGRCFP